MEGLRSESEIECFGSRRILDLKLCWRFFSVGRNMGVMMMLPIVIISIFNTPSIHLSIYLYYNPSQKVI